MKKKKASLHERVNREKIENARVINSVRSNAKFKMTSGMNYFIAEHDNLYLATAVRIIVEGA